ncbi:MAG TPA: LysR family transcriptional regulator [Steroidobacteraceae bacterium]|nr:LysR family transcriptional regulator [Steroidobacteraceae bacterium]
MPQLNYRYLRYFWAVAHAGNLGQAAAQLNVSQSALSVQIKKFEEQLGHALFERKGRGLVLTEAGRIALDYADVVFRTGEELLGTLAGRRGADRQTLRVGAITTLSRNFQLELLHPLLDRADVKLIVRSGSLRELLVQLDAHEIDVVLANQAVRRDAGVPWYNHLLNEQPVSLVSRPEIATGGFRFPQDLAHVPVLLPSLESEIRVAFDRVLELAEVRPTILGEVDDMAMLRLLARESSGVTLVPPVVVREELESGALVERSRIPDITERFYAITGARRFPNRLLRDLLSQPSN